MSENELPTARLSKVSHRQTDRKTERSEIIYHAASRVVKKRHNAIGVTSKLTVNVLVTFAV